MATDNCLRVLKESLAETHKPGEIDALQEQMFEALESRRAYLQQKMHLSPDLARIEAARQLGEQTRMLSYVAKRNAAMNLVKRNEWTGWVQQHFGTNFARGFESMLVGIQSSKMGTRYSVETVQRRLRDEYMSGMTEQMRKAGVLDLFLKHDLQFDHDTFIARGALNMEDKAAAQVALANLPDKAIETARIINAWADHARIKANDAGAWIGKLDGYAGQQTHNAELIFNAGYDAWKAKALKRFDLARMISERGTVDQDAMLKSIYETLSSNIHEVNANPLVGSVGTRNIGKALSQSRTIHYLDGEAAWLDHRDFGGNYSPALTWGQQTSNVQSLAHSVFEHLGHMSQATGLMEVMGPNPQALLKTLIGDAEQTLKNAMTGPARVAAKKNLDLLTARTPDLNEFMKAVDGSTNTVGSAMKAKIGQSIRNWTQLVDLGGMLLSQFSDVAQHMSGSNYRGKGYMSGLHESVVGLFGTDLKDVENRRLAASLGIMIDNFLGEMARAGSFDLPGQTSKMLQSFYKWNGANWWNSHMRFAAAAGLSNDLAQDAGKTFTELHPGMQRVLGQYNIGEKEWNAIRSSRIETIHGNNYLVPENVGDARTQGLLRDMISDQSSFSQLEPDAKTRALMMNMVGGQAGTWRGEIARSVLQFKSFNAAFMQKTLGRELFGRGFEYDNASSMNVFNAMVHGRGGEQAAVATIGLIATAFGYASLVAKDIAKGIAPQDPSQLNNTQRINLALRAMQQGAGAGIWGDFLLGQAARTGGNAADVLLGPVVGRGTGAVNWVVKMRDELAKGEVKPDVGAGLYKGLVSSIPGNNLPYATWALNYMVNYRVQEALNPGFLSRREAQMQRDSQQHFYIRPQTGKVLP